MKKYIISALLFSGILSSSCNSTSDSKNKHKDSLNSGNTDSMGSQPVQPGPGAANGGNATDTIAHESTPAPRTDSVVRH
jgi:hypothetical protein